MATLYGGGAGESATPGQDSGRDIEGKRKRQANEVLASSSIVVDEKEERAVEREQLTNERCVSFSLLLSITTPLLRTSFSSMWLREHGLCSTSSEVDTPFSIVDSSHSKPFPPIKKTAKPFFLRFNPSTAAKRKREQWLPSEEEHFFDSLRILRGAGEGPDCRGGVTAISTAISRAIGTKDVDQVRGRGDANSQKIALNDFFSSVGSRASFLSLSLS